MTGHCSKCGKIWTLDTAQGVCQWCGQQATCQTSQAQARSIKARARGMPRQAPDNGGGYDRLPEPYFTYHKVASRYSHKAPAQDRGDLIHDTIIALADVARHKTLTRPAMYRIASVTVANYWRTHYKLTSGIDCGSCSKAQRRKCKEGYLYNQCPKAIKLEYLSKPMIDSEGNITELGELIADDKAIDLDQWVDAKAFRLGCPQRLIDIAHKIREKQGLTATESRYLYKFRKKHQKALF